MRTKIYTIALITLTIVTNTFMAFASPVVFEEEAYIDDIPFNTHIIFENLTLENTFGFGFEEYIDDIPFDTFEIASKTDSISPDFDNEPVIDDIPFSTNKVVAELKYADALQIDFDFEEEAYVDDIPFNTELIASRKANNQTISYFLIEIYPAILF